MLVLTTDVVIGLYPGIRDWKWYLVHILCIFYPVPAFLLAFAWL